MVLLLAQLVAAGGALLLCKFFPPSVSHSTTCTLDNKSHVSLLPLPATTAQPLEISVLSWNILAPCYTTRHPPRQLRRSQTIANRNADGRAKDEDVLPAAEYMDWSYRRPRIVQTIASYEADLVCLQEVELEAWPTLRDELAQRAGYQTAVVQTVSRGLAVATVILLHNRRLDEWKVTKVESRSRALLVTLECHQSDKANDSSSANKPTYLFIGNVHLQAARHEFVTRYQQVKSLLKRLHLHTQRVPGDDGGQPPDENPLVLLVGDFNTFPTDPLYLLLTTGSLPSLDNHNLPQLYPNLPLLPLRDMMIHDDPERATTTLSWTHSCGAVLDYVLASPATKVVERWTHSSNNDDTLSTSVTTPRRPIPNADFPSDHLPVGGILRFWT